MSKCKYTARPEYKEVEIVAKTTRATTGTVDRKTIGRCLLTEAEGFTADKPKVVVDGDDTVIRTVKKAEEVQVFVKLCDGQKSAASFKFFDCWVAPNAENEGVTDVFTDNGENITRAENCARRMCDANPGVDGQWEIVDKDGKRVFLRLVAKDVNEYGKIRD